jgi:hypothetical protein
MWDASMITNVSRDTLEEVVNQPPSQNTNKICIKNSSSIEEWRDLFLLNTYVRDGQLQLAEGKRSTGSAYWHVCRQMLQANYAFLYTRISIHNHRNIYIFPHNHCIIEAKYTHVYPTEIVN